MDEAPANLSQASTLQANREGAPRCQGSLGNAVGRCLDTWVPQGRDSWVLWGKGGKTIQMPGYPEAGNSGGVPGLPGLGEGTKMPRFFGWGEGQEEVLGCLGSPGQEGTRLLGFWEGWVLGSWVLWLGWLLNWA